MKIVLASRNKKKISELNALLAKHIPEIEVLSLDDIGFFEEIEENGKLIGRSSENLVVHVNGDEKLKGTFQNATITDFDGVLLGEINFCSIVPILINLCYHETKRQSRKEAPAVSKREIIYWAAVAVLFLAWSILEGSL